MSAPASAEFDLLDIVESCYADPLRFVMACFPWGEPGPLQNHAGPDEWQRDDVYTDLDNIGALEAAIAAPAWDPVLDGWMVPALGWANEDLIGDLNTASIAAEQAHQAHCY